MRTHYCGEVTEALLDETVTVCGWAHRRRDHGGIIFVDLRDREGLLQVVFDPDEAAAFETRRQRCAANTSSSIRGRVRRRPPGTENPKLPTGQVELSTASRSRSSTGPRHRPSSSTITTSARTCACATATWTCAVPRCSERLRDPRPA
ncbi:MAG: OB-fold nucleic acid binding domain-containing protein [Arhodomonas sp.]|nr:OB-fold nucleic acid binding domain-containing protein [Arhodomonas sp.]